MKQHPDYFSMNDYDEFDDFNDPEEGSQFFPNEVETVVRKEVKIGRNDS